MYDKIPRFTEEDWIQYYINRGASEAEACQLRNLRYSYGIVTGVNNAGEPGVWAYSIDLSTVEEILSAWILESRIKEALLQLKSDFESGKVKEGKPRRLSSFSELLVRMKAMESSHIDTDSNNAGENVARAKSIDTSTVLEILGAGNFSPL